MKNTIIGIIGGSGLEDPDIMKDINEIEIDTPYGKPSSNIIEGKIGEKKVLLLSRHGKQHTIPPTQINNRANIYALKQAGCTHIIATTACGSLREKIKRGDFVFPDQFIDFTRNRKLSFFESFEPGQLKHTPMAEPFDEKLRTLLIEEATKLKIPHHQKGTIITIEGPRFSTRAESNMFRLWGGDLINMSTAPEVILANELEIPYAAIAMSTDYDCWKEDEKPVTWEEVIEVFQKNTNKVVRLLIAAIENFKE
ncbi:MAG: S-methyl-5'-thioadenosine phosphorylase [Marinilabiliales bacterium]